MTEVGERTPYAFRGRRMKAEEAAVQGIVVIDRDTSIWVLNEQRLEVARRVLRQNLRNEFNVIHGWAESIENPRPRERITETVDYLVEVGEKVRMMATIGGRADAHRRPVDVGERMATILDEFRAAYPDVQFEADITASPVTIESRDHLLGTTVRNVLENAIEHNDSADPWVRVDVDTSPGGHGSRFTISARASRRTSRRCSRKASRPR